MSWGQNDTFLFLGSLEQMVVASQEVLWSVRQAVLYIRLTGNPAIFLANSRCFKKVLWRFRQVFFTVVSQMAVASDKFFGGFR